MNARRHEEDSLRTVKKILGIAGVACLALACALPAWAGTNQPAGNQAGTTPVTGPAQPAAKASPGAPAQAAAATSQPQAPPATPQAPSGAATPKPAAPAEMNPASQAKGAHEGIAVHGHWTIEVKNPDGAVTARREFDNAIQPSGMSYLASLLAGQNGAGGLSIMLNGGTTTFTAPPQPLFIGFGSEAGPCLQVSYNVGNPHAVGGLPTGTACLITGAPNASGNASELGSVCAYSAMIAAQANQPSPCSTNLAATAPTLTSTDDGAGLSAQISLTGSVTVTSANPGNVTDVETVFGACDANSTASNCLNASQVSTQRAVPGANPVAVNFFTRKNLDGPANGDPAPVPYLPGQTIAVTVTISFQ